MIVLKPSPTRHQDQPLYDPRVVDEQWTLVIALEISMMAFLFIIGVLLYPFL